MIRFLDPAGKAPTHYNYAVHTGMKLNGLEIVALTNSEEDDDLENTSSDETLGILFTSASEGEEMPIYLPDDTWLVLWNPEKKSYVSLDDHESHFSLDEDYNILTKHAETTS